MEEKIVSPKSFFETASFNLPKNIYKVKAQKVLTLLDLAKQQVQDILQHKFIIHHRAQLRTYLFQLEIANKYKTWIILKRLTQLIHLENSLKYRYQDKMPSIPIRTQQEIVQENCQQVLKFFQIFISTIINNQDIRQEKQFKKFIENLVPEDRKKIKIFKQIELNKQAGGRHTQSLIQRALSYFINWTSRYFTITSQGVYYTDSDQSFDIKEMIPFCVGFTLQYGQVQTGNTYGILINSSHRILNADAGNIFNLVFFVYFLKKAMFESDQLMPKRFKSFASVKQNCRGKYYIDGKDYFKDVYQALLTAKRQVFITGWMISPYFCLVRPDPQEETRFDRVIEKIAKNGVKVNIIVYMAPPVALNLNSEFTQTHLGSLHSNVKVLRHPAYLLIPFLWSHHQKMVIIDQKIAFLGGLDIGYGRMDDQKHILNDQKQQIWKGVDYCNYRIKDIIDPVQYTISTIDRSNTPRMPWHDIAIQISGGSVLDISRHFVQYWNYVNFQLSMDQRQLLIYAGITQQNQGNNLNLFKFNTLDKKKSNITPSKLQRAPMHRSSTFQIPIEDSQEMGNIHNSYQYNVVDNHHQQLQYYATHLKQHPAKKMEILLKKFNPTILFTKNKLNFGSQLIVNTVKNVLNLQGNQHHQLLRSASMWGLGLQQNRQQKSILNAYVELIYNSKEFIYIENQFFICVENPIAKAIKQRIARAYDSIQPFKVVVIIPALPGFDGQPQQENSVLVRVQIDYIYKTICRGQDSIFQQLSYIKNLDQYIQFFNLRTHGYLNQTPVSEIIYVHSKLMIVDDQIVLIGSANINDRSLMGSRDSQIGIIVEDQQKQFIMVGKNKRQVSKFAHSLRKQLYMQHFKITQKQSQDYLNNDIWWSIIENAQKNVQIYREIFGCYPDNKIKRFQDINKIKQKSDLTKYQILKSLIKGNAIKFQQYFLEDQNLQISASNRQYFIPSISFT